MNIQLSTAERLLYEVIRSGCISVKMTKSGDLSVEHDTPPDYLVPRKIKHIDVQKALKRLVDGRVWYFWDNSQLYLLEPPKVQIMPLRLVPERIEKEGLVVSVEGIEYTGYKAIAKAVFGGYHKDMLQELAPYLRSNFDLEEVVFVKMRRIKSREYAVYRWRGYDLSGITNVKKKLFWLSDDDIEKLQRLQVENKQSLTEKRSDQLIRLFDLSKEDSGYVMTNPENQKEELVFTSKKKVLEYIRGHKLGGSVSRETAKQIFETIEGEVKWE